MLNFSATSSRSAVFMLSGALLLSISAHADETTNNSLAAPAPIMLSETQRVTASSTKSFFTDNGQE